MTKHKFTDEEIIKALRCLSGEEIFCKDCSFGSLADHGFACKKNVSKAALDLINRQKAEIEKLTVDLVGMRGAANSYKMHYDRVKDLNAALEADLVNANMNLNHITYEFDLLKQEKSVVVAEAVKEFDERLKGKMQTVQMIGSGEYVRAVTDKHIDDTVKEMIGETS